MNYSSKLLFLCKNFLTKYTNSMKNFNKSIILICMISFLIPVLNSCTKKGDEDPGLSFRSRKSRLTGEWELKSGSEQSTTGVGNSIITYSNGTATLIVNNLPPVVSQHIEEIEFTKDNTFKSTLLSDGTLTVTEGFWSFMQGYDEIKDKECIVLRTAKYTSQSFTAVISGDEMPVTVLKLKKLSNDEIIIESEGTQIFSGVENFWKSIKTYSKK